MFDEDVTPLPSGDDLPPLNVPGMVRYIDPKSPQGIVLAWLGVNRDRLSPQTVSEIQDVLGVSSPPPSEVVE